MKARTFCSRPPTVLGCRDGLQRLSMHPTTAVASTVMQPDTGFGHFFGLGAVCRIDVRPSHRSTGCGRSGADRHRFTGEGFVCFAHRGDDQRYALLCQYRRCQKRWQIQIRRHRQPAKPRNAAPAITLSFPGIPPPQIYKWLTILYSISTATSAVRGMCLSVCPASPYSGFRLCVWPTTASDNQG